MAEKKYDLALVETVTNQPIKHQEWYKERLKTKYIKQLKSGERITTEDSQNWLFLKHGLDDFRDGLPPSVEDSDFLKTGKGPGPALHNDFTTVRDVKQPAARKRLTGYQTYLCRSTPQQQQRRDYIYEVEQGLLTHPLALYPHLEESVAPELFEDIVDLLDPQFNVHEQQEDELLSRLDEDGEISTKSSNETMASRKSAAEEKDKIQGPDLNPKNPYRWLPRKDNKKDGKKSKEKDRPWPTSPSEEEHIKKVTQEFCDWVADLGGESNNIEESTITSLFASGYETKPALSVPIHVVELTNVPQELRMTAAVPPPPIQEKQPAVGDKPKKKITGDYEPSWVHFRYGAWYLSPRTWRKMGFLEPLEDPKHLKEQEMSEAKKRSDELNQELATMHASKAFSDFINKKNTRRPEFLVQVAEIQKKAAEEEQNRQEAEQLAKQKRANTQQKVESSGAQG